MAWVTVSPSCGEQVAELGLRAHLLAGQQVDDLLLARGLRGRDDGGTHLGHGEPSSRRCSSSQLSSAFWACSRFSASSHTTLCGPSMTSAAISLPR